MKIEKEIFALEIEINTDKLTLENRFIKYCRNLRKLPSNDVYLDFLEQLKANPKFLTTLFPIEHEYIYARKIWTDVVSETDQSNAKTDVKSRVIARIKRLNTQLDPEKIYAKCLHYLVEESILVVTLSLDLSTDDLESYQLLNMFEKKFSRGTTYKNNRERAEAELYQHLSKMLYKNFLQNIHARPRYGTLFLPDRNHVIDTAYQYGTIFIVYKAIAKLNALFSPGDSLDHFVETKSAYTLSTLHHMEYILWQCPPATFQAIVSKAITGELPIEFDQRAWSENFGGYIEAQIAGFDSLDPNLIDHIHINLDKQLLNSDELQLLKNHGIKITNSPESSYRYWIKDLSNQQFTAETMQFAFVALRNNSSVIGINLNNVDINDGMAALILNEIKENKNIILIKSNSPINKRILDEINKQLQENLNWLVTLLFHNFYQPERDFSYEMPLLYEKQIMYPAYQEQSTRYQETLNAIQISCRVKKLKAKELFTSAYTQWRQHTDVSSLCHNSAEKLANKILEKIFQFKTKKSFFWRKTYVLEDNEKISLPNVLSEMLDYYIDQGYEKCVPEEFIEKCIEISKKSIGSNKNNFLNLKSELEAFCLAISKIQIPEQSTEFLEKLCPNF